MNDGRFLFQWEFKAVNIVEVVLGDFVSLSGSFVFFRNLGILEILFVLRLSFEASTK